MCVTIPVCVHKKWSPQQVRREKCHANNLSWAQVRIELQSENGLLGIGPYPPESEVDSVFNLEVLVVSFLFGGFHS